MEKKTALVTGGSRGIGKSIKESLMNEQIEVISPSRNELDLSSFESMNNFLTNFSTSIDILVNNAGILKVGQHNELSSIDFQEILQVNVIAPFVLMSKLSHSMKENKYGRIVNVSSIWSQVSREGRSVYSASKAAVDSLTRSFALELSPYSILVNSIAPGYVNTELIKKNNSQTELDSIKKNIPLERFAEPSEIANLATFLCSEKNSYITGQVIIMDGGYTCK